MAVALSIVTHSSLFICLVISLDRILQFVEKAFALGHDLLVFGAGKFTEQSLLAVGEALGNFDQNLHDFITVAIGTDVGQPFALEFEDFAVLGAVRESPVFRSP